MFRRHVGSAVLCVFLVACADEKQPAQAQGGGNGAAAAAARKAMTAALEERWAALAEALPADAAAIGARIEALQKPSGRQTRAGIDLDAARAALSDAGALWSKAQAAFATGNLTEAVAIGERLESRYRALAASLQMQNRSG